jgi:hypothetical protein
MPSEPEFYVGYLPSVPPGIARLRRKAVAGLLAFAVALAVILVLGQHELSVGFFDFFNTAAYEGVIVARPYPALLQSGQAQPLVAVGKFGTADETAGLNGRIVRLQAKSIRLGGRQMLEVAPGGITALAGQAEPAAAPETDLGAFTLEGEIVDSKCYLGVMNPGRGKVHKGCAVRCISGGVPPGFLVKDAAGSPALFLLTDPGGEPVNEAALPLVGRAIRLTGRLVKTSGMTYFRADLQTAAAL